VLANYNVDAIYDCVGGQNSWDLCRAQHVLKMDGRYATIVGDQMHGEELTVGSILGTGLSLMNRKFWGAVGHQKYDFVMADSSRNLRDITALIDGGKIKAVLDAESPFKFEEYKKVFEKCKNHSARGKLVLHIADDEETEEDDDEVEETPNLLLMEETPNLMGNMNGDIDGDDNEEEEEDDGKEEEYQGMNGNVRGSRSNTFMLYDDGYKDVSAPEEEHYETFEHYEEDDGDGDDEKEEVDEAKVEEENGIDDGVNDNVHREIEEEVDSGGQVVAQEVEEENGVETMDEVVSSSGKTEEVKTEKVVIVQDEEDLDNLLGDTADIADKQDMAHDNIVNAVH